MSHHELVTARIGLFLALFSLLSASCAPAATPSPTPKLAAPTPATTTVPSKQAPEATSPVATPKPAADQPRHGGNLLLPCIADLPNLDIHATVAAALFAPMGAVYNGVVQFDQSNKVVPDLAERWEMSPDGKVYTFSLRKGVKWHDGKPFSSADAKASLERIDKFDGLKFATEMVDKIETPDETTLKVTLRQRQAGFLPILGHGRALIGPKHVIDAKKDLKRDAIGTGPFTLKEYISGISYIMDKNKEYFIKERPYLDRITYYIIRDSAARFAGFRTGRLHIWGHAPTHADIGPTEAEIMKKDMSQAVVRPFKLMMGWVLLPNWTREPWSDVRVRRAAFLAVDREKGLEVVTQGAGGIGISFFFGEWALPREELMSMPGFRKPKDADIAEAKRLLAEAGYPTGFQSSVLVRAAYPMYERGAVFMKDQLAKIGIDLKLEVLEYAIWADARARRSYDTMLVMSSSYAFDPDEAGRMISWKMGGQWASGDDDKMLDLYEKQSTAATTEERRKLVYEIQRRVAEVVPHIMNGWQDSFLALQPYVKNYTAESGVYSHNKFDEIWLAK